MIEKERFYTVSKKQILAATGIVIAIALGAFWWANNVTDNNSNNSRGNKTQVGEQISVKAVSSNEGKTVRYDGVADKNALEQLKSLTTTETKTTSFGDMVVSINGLKAEDTKNYWAFYVNNQYANEGAGTYKMKASDKIEWRLEAIQ